MLPVSYFTLFPEYLIPYQESTVSQKKRQEWAVRTFCAKKYSYAYDIVKVYNRKQQGYWKISSYTALKVVEAAYIDYCHKAYMEADSNSLVTYLEHNVQNIVISLKPPLLNKAHFFDVIALHLYIKKQQIQFHTQSGDRYVVSYKCNNKLQEIVKLIGVEHFKNYRTIDPLAIHNPGGGGRFIMSHELDEYTRDKINSIAKEIIFHLDYRFQGHSEQYASNRSWHIYPVEVMTRKDFIFAAEQQW